MTNVFEEPRLAVAWTGLPLELVGVFSNERIQVLGRNAALVMVSPSQHAPGGRIVAVSWISDVCV